MTRSCGIARVFPAIAAGGSSAMGNTRRVLIVGLLAAALVGLASWGAFRYLSPPSTPVASAPAGTVTVDPATGARRIKASLFYIGEDGLRLVPVEHDVPYAEGPNEQARQIIQAQLPPPAPPLISAIPEGTTLRGVYVTASGEAYVDFSGAIRSAHPGGSLNEIFTVYAIVSVLTVNLPAITSVQILIDGHEVDTLAGHVDLRRPLPGSAQWLERPGGQPAPTTPTPPGRTP